MSHGLSRRSLWGRSWPAFMSRGLLVSLKDQATSMSSRPGPALRRALLVISPNTPETCVSQGPSRRSLWGRSWRVSTSRDLLASSKDRATSMSSRPGPALRCSLLVISPIAPETYVSQGPRRRSLWDRSWQVSTSRGVFMFSKDQATSMSYPPGPALRCSLLVISPIAPET